MELLVARCAGLDVAKDEVVACVRLPDGRGGRAQEVRTFPTFTSGLEALAGWLTAEGVVQVVMEATGQLLEAGLVGAGGGRLRAAGGQRPPRQDPPGRKTDVGDAAWLAELLEHGLLGGSFVPPAPIRELRELTRYRKRPVPGPWRGGPADPAGPWRMPASSRVSVAAEVLGVSGRAMLAALVAGERDPGVLAELAKGRLRAKLPQLGQALRGRFGAITRS